MECRACKPGKGETYEEINDVFERVWKRVMPDNRESPIIVEPAKRKAKSEAALITTETKVRTEPPSNAPEVTTSSGGSATGSTIAGGGVSGVSTVTEIRPDAGSVSAANETRPDTGSVNAANEIRAVVSSVSTTNGAAVEEAVAGNVPVYAGMENGTDEVITDIARIEAGLSTTTQRASATRISIDCHCQDDFPSALAVPCLGSESANFDGLLQDMIRKELDDWLYYRTLSRRVSGIPARTFAAMAADEWQHAKRLSAAYFLISGIRYWPEKSGKVNITSYLTALRQRFIEEQQEADHYTAAATESSDVCLCQLFLDIADENNRHTQQIRSLVEQL